METRARYALIGLFMLAVILASFGFVYWLENKGGFGERETYRVRLESSVSGLLIGSAVLFNGILTGGVAVTLTGGTSTTPLTADGGVPTLVAPPGVGQDWTQSARDAFQEVQSVIAQNATPLNEAINNIEVFTDCLARNAD